MEYQQHIEIMKSYTDIEQSNKLAEILPIESADHHYARKVTDFRGNPVDGEWSHPKYGNPNSKYAKYIVQNFTSYEKLPCWSLAAMLDIFPCSKESPIVNLTRGGWDPSFTRNWFATLEDEDKNVFYSCNGTSSIDAVVELILKLHEQKLL